MKKFVIFFTVFVLAAASGAGWFYQKPIIRFVDLLYTANEPREVANDFWLTALSSPRSAQPFILSGTGQATDYFPVAHKQNSFVLGEAHQQEGIYFIDTTLFLVKDGRMKSIPIYTVVNSDNGAYKVDLDNSMRSYHDAAISRAISYYTDTMRNAQDILPVHGLSDVEKLQLIQMTKASLEERLCAAADELMSALSGKSKGQWELCSIKPEDK